MVSENQLGTRTVASSMDKRHRGGDLTANPFPGIPLNQTKTKEVEFKINHLIGACCAIDRTKAGDEKAQAREMMQLSKMNAHLTEVLDTYMDQVKILQPVNLQDIMTEYVYKAKNDYENFMQPEVLQRYLD